jgi:hypothetical protein
MYDNKTEKIRPPATEPDRNFLHIYVVFVGRYQLFGKITDGWSTNEVFTSYMPLFYFSGLAYDPTGWVAGTTICDSLLIRFWAREYERGAIRSRTDWTESLVQIVPIFG